MRRTATILLGICLLGLPALAKDMDATPDEPELVAIPDTKSPNLGDCREAKSEDEGFSQPLIYKQESRHLFQLRLTEQRGGKKAPKAPLRYGLEGALFYGNTMGIVPLSGNYYPGAEQKWRGALGVVSSKVKDEGVDGKSCEITVRGKGGVSVKFTRQLRRKRSFPEGFDDGFVKETGPFRPYTAELTGSTDAPGEVVKMNCVLDEYELAKVTTCDRSALEDSIKPRKGKIRKAAREDEADTKTIAEPIPEEEGELPLEKLPPKTLPK